MPVKIYRLLTADSYEKHMFDVASKKLGLATAVLGTCSPVFCFCPTELVCFFFFFFFF